MNEQKLYFVTVVHKILSSEHNFGLFVMKHASLFLILQKK